MKTEAPISIFSVCLSSKWRLIHCSKRPGSSCSSSGRQEAENIIAFTPVIMLVMKATAPRITGHPRTGYLSFSGCTSSTFVTYPSGVLQTMACRAGPFIIMPSIRA